MQDEEGLFQDKEEEYENKRQGDQERKKSM